ETKIFIASGNTEEEINLLTLFDHDNLLSVRGTDSNNVLLPCLSLDPFSKQANQAIFNIYKDQDGKYFFVVKDKKIPLYYEEIDSNNNPLIVHYSDGQSKITPVKENLEYVLGKDLKGRPYNEVKDNLLAVKHIISNEPISPGELTDEQVQKLREFKVDYFNLSKLKQEYLESKKDFYLPINIKTNYREGGSKSDLEKYYIDDKRLLFIGVNDKGNTFWSPDGSKPEENCIVIGFIIGTSFSSPVSLMKSLEEFTKKDKLVSFTGQIKLMPENKKLALYA
ncbi:MAG: hypothetical protein AB7V50_05780, partial [Vampirovibrionia bacterium]